MELLKNECGQVASSSSVHFDVFLIGEAPETSRPYIMFSCARCEPRKTAVAAMKKSDFYIQCPPGISLGHWEYPPHLENFRFCACSEYPENFNVNTDEENQSFTSLCDAKFISEPDSGKPVMVQVLQLAVSDTYTEPKSLRTATIGCAFTLSGRHFGVAPAHVGYHQAHMPLFKVPELDRKPEDGECELEGFSDEDDDEIEVDFMSNYSKSAESSDLENDSDLGESDSTSDNESDYIASTVSAEIPDTVIVTSGNDEYCVPDRTENSSSSHSCRQETEFWFLKSDSLDYCLVEIDEGEPYLQDLPTLCRENIGQLGSKSVDVTAATCSGNILMGVLSPYLSCIRLPNATRYTNILTVQFEGCLQQGDSGSMVRDARTGMIYGHIIAGDPISQVAFIVPAIDVFNDAMEKITHIDETSVKFHARKCTDQAEPTKSQWRNSELSSQGFWKFPSYRQSSIPDVSTVHLRRVPCFSLPRPRGGYAAAVPAAYAKELLSVVPIEQFNNTTMERDSLENPGKRILVSIDAARSEFFTK